MKINLANQPFYLKLACVLISLIGLGYLTITAKEILSPVVFSCLFSILLLPVAKFLENKCRLPRSGASMLSVLLLLAFVGMILYLVGNQVSSLGTDWTQFKEQLSSTITDLRIWIFHKFHINASKQLDYVHDATNKIMASGTGVVGATLLSLSSMLLFLVFTFIYTFFFLVYRSLIMKFLVRVFLEENAGVVKEIVEQVQYIMRKYIVGLLIEMSIVTIVVSTVFSIMGLKYAILLGLITGLFNIVPYIGIFSAMLISSLITFATGGASEVLWVIVVLASTHLVDSNVLLPVIVGSKVRINAMVTVLGVVIGEMIWGISGMFLSVPIVAVLKIIFDRVESLKPWGLILGDDEKKAKKASGLHLKRKKPSLEKDLAREI